ncbi:MarR family winged helix-turn-helix transcriptional regulator [Trujillonella endophytica]|uniref:MarR family winged helix-turn-helix transcriptional regulator n=1 Tax=Trujillonella endophytica TaxID=673521 RepID=UPI00147FCDFD|nr:MarR family transcriptional regulator [Trujillella endophytica]
MPRDSAVGQVDGFSADAMLPLTGVDGPDLQTAVYDIVTWATSATLLRRLMAAGDFPLREDAAAFRLFLQLVYRGAARPTEVAAAIETSRSNVARIGRRLEDAGLVARRPDPEDDRAVVLGLTEDGRVVGRRILDTGLRLFSPVLAGWSATDVATLQRLLLDLAGRLRTP